MATVNTAPPQEDLVKAIAPALPAYNFTSDEWFDILMTLRLISRANPKASDATRLFLEDVSRAADAMHNRLKGSSDYLGKDELDEVLGAQG